MGMGGGSSGPTSTTTSQPSSEVGYWLNKYLGLLGPMATSQFQAMSPYSTPQLLQSLGLTQQETFGGPSVYPFPQVAPSGAVNQQLPPPNYNANPAAPAKPMANPYVLPSSGVTGMA